MKNPAATKIGRGERIGGAPGTRTGIPLQSMVQTAHGEAAEHLQPMEIYGGAEIDLKPMQDPRTEQVDV